MNLTLFKIEINSYRNSLLIWALIISLIIVIQLIVINSIISPGGTLTMGYLSLAMVFMINPILSVFALNTGMKSLVKEETNGTIVYLCAQPISRASIVFTKIFAAVLTYFLLIVILAIVSLVTFQFIIGTGMTLSESLSIIVNIFSPSFIIGLMFLAIGFMLSAFSHKNKRKLSLANFIIFVTYIAGIASLLPNIKLFSIINIEVPQYLQNLQYISPFIQVPSLFSVPFSETASFILGWIFTSPTIYYPLSEMAPYYLIIITLVISVALCFIGYLVKDLKT